MLIRQGVLSEHPPAFFECLTTFILNYYQLCQQIININFNNYWVEKPWY